MLPRMGAMQKLTIHNPVVVVEWRSASDGTACGSQQLAKDDLLAIASALGRLAARRDLARLKQEVVAARLSSDQNGATMSTKEPA